MLSSLRNPITILLVTVVLFGYQNCGSQFSAVEDSVSQASSDPGTPPDSTVPSVSGATISSTTIVVNGSSFGTKTSAAPFHYENFDARAPGSSITNIPAYTYDAEYGQIGVGSVTVDNTQAASGGRSAVHKTGVNPDVGDGIRESFPHIAVNGMNTRELYMTYRLRYSTNGVGAVRQLKFNRAAMETSGAYGSPCYGGSPKFYESYYPTAGISGSLNSLQGGIVRSDQSVLEGWVGETLGTTPPAVINENSWVQVEVFYKLNDIGQANGQYVTYVNGHRNFNLANLQMRTQINQLLQCSYLVIGIDYFLTATNNDGVSVWYDDHYIDTTRARLVLANAAVYDNATNRTPQPAVTWTSSQISASLNTTGFTSGSPAWLYVIRADGTVSAGHAVVVP